VKKIVVIAPHPDDETLGCGGSLFSHKAESDELFWLIVTGIDEKDGWSAKNVQKRNNEINAVAERYKFNNVFDLNYPTTKIDTTLTSDIIGKIAEVHKKVEPEIIYMPFAYDVHTDHQLIAKAVQSTIKCFRYPFIQKVLMYETLSETDFNFVVASAFQPNVFVDISDYLSDKIETMKIYASELGEHPFPRSEKALRALATLRGSQSGYEAAEAFQLVYERL